jgi:hypothetical protein
MDANIRAENEAENNLRMQIENEVNDSLKGGYENHHFNPLGCSVKR